MRYGFIFISCYVLFVLTAFNSYGQKLDYTFVVIGDDRVAPSDTIGDPSTANLYHFKRILAEIAQLNPLPKYVFVNGDLVMGYTGNDTVRYAHELKEWIKVYKSSPVASRNVELVAIPGNHEIADKINGKKLASAANERVFVREMKEYIHGDNGPHATGLLPGTDSLVTDQSKLSYSFNFGGDHFVILNTDPYGRDSRVAWHWLKMDLATSRNNDTRHIFVFGHKPPFPSIYKGETGLDENKTNRDSMWAAIEKYNCDIYFSSHIHLWDTVHPHSNKTWEIICGNAGAPMVKEWQPSYYGYTIVHVYSKVDITSMGHNADKEHSTDPTPNNPTTTRAKFTIE